MAIPEIPLSPWDEIAQHVKRLGLERAALIAEVKPYQLKRPEWLENYPERPDYYTDGQKGVSRWKVLNDILWRLRHVKADTRILGEIYYQLPRRAHWFAFDKFLRREQPHDAVVLMGIKRTYASTEWYCRTREIHYWTLDSVRIAAGRFHGTVFGPALIFLRRYDCI